jgi:hypothetical protein
MAVNDPHSYSCMLFFNNAMVFMIFLYWKIELPTPRSQAGAWERAKTIKKRKTNNTNQTNKKGNYE